MYKAQELGIGGKLSFSASDGASSYSTAATTTTTSSSSSSAPVVAVAASGAMREAFGTAQGEV